MKAFRFYRPALGSLCDAAQDVVHASATSASNSLPAFGMPEDVPTAHTIAPVALALMALCYSAELDPVEVMRGIEEQALLGFFKA